MNYLLRCNCLFDSPSPAKFNPLPRPFSQLPDFFSESPNIYYSIIELLHTSRGVSPFVSNIIMYAQRGTSLSVHPSFTFHFSLFTFLILLREFDEFRIMPIGYPKPFYMRCTVSWGENSMQPKRQVINYTTFAISKISTNV